MSALIPQIPIEILERQMELRRFSLSTITTYTSCLRTFLAFTQARALPAEDPETVRAFLHILVKKGYSRSTQNQYINAIKYYLEQYLGMEKQFFFGEVRPKLEKRLPKLLSKEEVSSILQAIPNLKHKALFSLIYAQGLRVGEALALQIPDVDGKRLMLHIRGAKGFKDRDIPLSPRILQLLRTYYKEYRPVKYLFEGRNGKMYSKSSVRQVLKRAVKSARINRYVTTHTLRHSYATHLLESGLDIRYIKELLGHSNIKTTEIYTHVTQTRLNNIQSPFENL
jgi:site-specific recombinase XerD